MAGIIASPLPDTRSPLLIMHSYSVMVTACMMAITAGYEDGDGVAPRSHADDRLQSRAGGGRIFRARTSVTSRRSTG